jgi:tetratricopeptide (TPR) repeat protein
VIAGLSILVPIFCMVLVYLLGAKTQRDRVIFGVCTGLLGAAIALHVWLLTPAKLGFPTFLPFQATREIAIDVLKDTKHTLFGYGYTSFQLAFTQLRPSSINSTPFWNVRFSSARNEAFQIFITLGVVGFVAWLLLLLSLVRSAFPFTTITKPVGVAILVVILEFLLIPANVSLIILLFLLSLMLTLVIKEHHVGKISDIVLHLFAFKIVSPTTPSQVEKQRASQVFAGISSGILLLGITVGLYFLTRMFIAETLMYRSLIAANKNDGARTYALQSQAVTIAPFIDRYHASFAVTNYLIANTMASSGSLSPEDKANIPEIIQQSIREAKLAAQINQSKVEHWETLASLYQQLIGVAQGSEQWAVAAYVKAIQLDPGNPNLRVQLGSVYMSIQNYDQALRMFQQAIELKPDWANAYYNLANAYVQKGDRKNAIENLQRTLQFLPESSTQERKAIEDQIAELKRLEQQNAKTVKPAASKSASNDVQIRLPADLGLPEEATPTGTTNQ